MSDRKYYCFCDLNCKFETMTKEQILAAIAQAAESGLVFDPDAAFITKVKETNAGNLLAFWVGTQAQYNALQTIDKNCFYIITDSTKDTDIANRISAIEKQIKELGAGNMSTELAWENASPDSEFSAQDIELGLTEDTRVLIEFVSAVPSAIVRVGKTFYANHLNVTSTDANKTVIELGRRAIALSTTKVTFTDCSRSIYTTSSGKFGDTATYNNYAKPFRIYILKGVS